MSVQLQVIRGTTVYDLSDAVAYGLLSYDGFGAPNVRNILQRGPLQHGATWRVAYLEPRLVQLVLWATGANLQALFTRNIELLEVFKPSSDPIKLRVTKPDGSRYQLDCRYSSGMTLGSLQHRGFSQNVAATLLAPDPTWYSPTTLLSEFVTTGDATGFMVPMTVPHFVGTSSIGEERPVTYAGTWEAYPVIRITGPITNPVVDNLTTDDTLDFTAVLGAGEYLEVNLAWGIKSVVDENGANQIALLSDDSDLTTWRLAPAPEASAGVNVVRVSGSGTGGGTKVTIAWHNRYLGI